LEPARLREPGQHRHVAPAVRRPLLGDHEHLGGAARLRDDPLPRLALGVGEPRRLERLAEELAVVLARHAERALALEVLGRAHELHVPVERHSLRETLLAHHWMGSLCSPKTSFMALLILPCVSYVFTAYTIAGLCVSVTCDSLD